MTAEDILKAAERGAGMWPTDMPGHVNFGYGVLDVAGDLEDGVHRLEGSAWQFVVEGGQIVQGVRQDMRAWWRDDHTVHDAPAEIPGSDDG